jgi:hypothetical protein
MPEELQRYIRWLENYNSRLLEELNMIEEGHQQRLHEIAILHRREIDGFMETIRRLREELSKSPPSSFANSLDRFSRLEIER